MKTYQLHHGNIQKHASSNCEDIVSCFKFHSYGNTDVSSNKCRDVCCHDNKKCQLNGATSGVNNDEITFVKRKHFNRQCVETKVEKYFFKRRCKISKWYNIIRYNYPSNASAVVKNYSQEEKLGSPSAPRHFPACITNQQESHRNEVAFTYHVWNLMAKNSHCSTYSSRQTICERYTNSHSVSNIV